MVVTVKLVVSNLVVNLVVYFVVNLNYLNITNKNFTIQTSYNLHSEL